MHALDERGRGDQAAGEAGDRPRDQPLVGDVAGDDLPELALAGLAALEPPDADAASVADAVVAVVDKPFASRPFRVHVDPSQDGAEVVNGVADRVRAELLRRIGLADVLR